MPRQYRGIDRPALSGWPVREHGVEHAPGAAEEPEAHQLLWDLERAGQAAEDFIFAVEDARRAYASLREPARWEIIWARDVAADVKRYGVGRTLGYEPT